MTVALSAAQDCDSQHLLVMVLSASKDASFVTFNQRRKKRLALGGITENSYVYYQNVQKYHDPSTLFPVLHTCFLRTSQHRGVVQMHLRS